MNHQETLEFFESHSYFGLTPQQVHFFPQGALPALDLEGRVVLENGGVYLSPSGNGGVYAALQQSGLVERMAGQGVRYT